MPNDNSTYVNNVTIKDYYFRNKNWFKRDKNFTPKKQAQELASCRTGPPEANLGCEDSDQGGKENWEEDTYQTPEWYIVRGDKAIRLWCPARRIMNTFDYRDVKVGIKLHYQVYGFYWTTDVNDKVINSDTNFQAGYTDIVTPPDVTCENVEKDKKCEPIKQNPLHYEGRRIRI